MRKDAIETQTNPEPNAAWPIKVGIPDRERLERSMETYARTVANEQRPWNRPEFRINPAKANTRITQG